jgi:type II restriction enzyme
MRLQFDINLAKGYKSPSQIIKKLSECWVGSNIYCPNCGNIDIEKYPDNKPVADFFCVVCREDYELKSKKKTMGMKINDGAYKTMVERLQSDNNPNFFFLNYSQFDFQVLNFCVIPKHFFTPGIIEKRKPLSKNADRHDWVGCNILLKTIPETGKIFFVKNSIIEPKNKVISEWKKTLFLREERDMRARGWLLDIMRCVGKLDKKKFILDDVYFFEKELKALHPENNHVKDKIRQQLQVLRDKGYLNFVSPGKYSLNK